MNPDSFYKWTYFYTMKFSVGDKMLIRKTGEEGYIVSILDTKMAEVSVGGTVFPVYIDDIDHPYLRWFTQKNKEQQKSKVLREQVPVEKPVLKTSKVASGIHLTFMPVFHLVEMEEQVERLKIFIVNHTHYTVEFRYDVRTGQETLFSYLGTLQPFTDIYLHYVDWDTMQDIPRFEWSVKETLSSQYAVHKDVIKIRSAKLFEQVSAAQKNNNPTFQYTLLQEFAPKQKEQPAFSFETIIPKTKLPVRSIGDIPKYEIDLHIEHLVDRLKGLSNADIIAIQLAELDKYLRIAINNKQDKMVIIHGVGKGVLRNEVLRVLKENAHVAQTESGWQAGYGFGATIVYFRYGT